MTDNEIIKALECVIGNRQKAEILELQKRIINWRADMDYRPDEIKSEAIKKFVERLKEHRYGELNNCISFSVGYLDNLVKEMTE